MFQAVAVYTLLQEGLLVKVTRVVEVVVTNLRVQGLSPTLAAVAREYHRPSPRHRRMHTALRSLKGEMDLLAKVKRALTVYGSDGQL